MKSRLYLPVSTLFTNGQFAGAFRDILIVNEAKLVVNS